MTDILISVACFVLYFLIGIFLSGLWIVKHWKNYMDYYDSADECIRKNIWTIWSFIIAWPIKSIVCGLCLTLNYPYVKLEKYLENMKKQEKEKEKENVKD